MADAPTKKPPTSFHSLLFITKRRTRRLSLSYKSAVSELVAILSQQLQTLMDVSVVVTIRLEPRLADLPVTNRRRVLDSICKQLRKKIATYSSQTQVTGCLNATFQVQTDGRSLLIVTLAETRPCSRTSSSDLESLRSLLSFPNTAVPLT